MAERKGCRTTPSAWWTARVGSWRADSRRRPTTFRTRSGPRIPPASPFATPRWITRCICIPRTGECCTGTRRTISLARWDSNAWSGPKEERSSPRGDTTRRCRVLNHVTWKAFAELPHPSRVVAPATVAVYEEVEEVVADRGSSNLADRARVAGASDIGQGRRGRAGGGTCGTELDDEVRDKDPVAAAARRRADIVGGRITARYVVRELPATLPGVKPDLFASEPKVGVNLSRVVRRRSIFWRRQAIALASVGVGVGHEHVRTVRGAGSDGTRAGDEVGPESAQAGHRHGVGEGVRVGARGAVSSEFLSRSSEREPCRGIRTGENSRSETRVPSVARSLESRSGRAAGNRASFAFPASVYSLFLAFDV